MRTLIFLLSVNNVRKLARDSCFQGCFVQGFRYFQSLFILLLGFFVVTHLVVGGRHVAQGTSLLARRRECIFEGKGLGETLKGAFKIFVYETDGSKNIQDRNGKRKCRSHPLRRCFVLLHFI